MCKYFAFRLQIQGKDITFRDAVILAGDALVGTYQDDFPLTKVAQTIVTYTLCQRCIMQILDIGGHPSSTSLDSGKFLAKEERKILSNSNMD